ncbi:MAG: hypothetical protein LQ339_008875, partial [Xanthoria mediterranea]
EKEKEKEKEKEREKETEKEKEKERQRIRDEIAREKELERQKDIEAKAEVEKAKALEREEQEKQRQRQIEFEQQQLLERQRLEQERLEEQRLEQERIEREIQEKKEQEAKAREEEEKAREEAEKAKEAEREAAANSSRKRKCEHLLQIDVPLSTHVDATPESKSSPKKRRMGPTETPTDTITTIIPLAAPGPSSAAASTSAPQITPASETRRSTRRPSLTLRAPAAPATPSEPVEPSPRSATRASTRNASIGRSAASIPSESRRRSATPAHGGATASTAASQRSRRSAPGPVIDDPEGGAAVSVGVRKTAPRKRATVADRSKQKGTEKQVHEEAVDEEIDPDEERYCVCGGVSWGGMVKCENNDILIKFTFACALIMNPNFSWPDPQGPPPQYTLHNHFLAPVHVWQAYQHPHRPPPFLPQAWSPWGPYPAQYSYSQLDIRHKILSEFNCPVHRAQYTYLHLDAGQYTVPEHHSPESQVHFISSASSSNSSPPYRHVPACGPFHHEISPHEDTKGEETKSTVDFSQWSSNHVQPHNQISSRRTLQETRDFNRWNLCQPTDSTVVNTSGNLQAPSLQASAQLLQCEANLSIAPPFFPPLVWVLDAQHGSNPSTVLSAQALPPSRKSMTPSQRLHKRKRGVLEKRDRHGHEKSATDIVLSTSQSVKKWRQQRTFSYWLPNELSELERYCAQRPGCSMGGLARGIHVSLGRTFSSVESKIKQMRKGK